MEVDIVSWEISSSWFVSSILIKCLPFSQIQMGVGTCFLDFGSARMPEKKPYFHYVHVSIKRFLLNLDVLKKFLMKAQ